MLDALASWLAGLIAVALNALPTWELVPGSFPFLGPLSQINYMVNLVPAFAVTLAAASLGPMFMLGTLSLWGYGLVRGGGHRA